MSSTSENSRLIAKNTLYMFLRMFLVTIVGLYTSRVILDVLGISDYGIYNVLAGVIVSFSFLQDALTNATYRFLTYAIGEDDFVKLRNTFSMAINLHLLLGLIVFLLSEFIGVWALNSFLNIPEERMYAANIAFQFSVLSFCVNIIRTPYNSIIISHERMDFYAYSSVVEVVLKLVIVFLLNLSAYDKLATYALLLLVVDVMLYLGYCFYCRRVFKECIYVKFWDKTMLSDMFKFSGWSVVVNATDVCVTQSIVFFFNVFFSVVTNAALGVANQVTSKVNLFLNSFSQAFNPQIIKAYARNEKEYFFNLIYTSSKISYFLLLLICLPLLLNIDYILNLWLVNVPNDTSVFIFYSLLYSMIDAYSAPLWISVYATGNLRTHQLLMSGIKILNIPLAYMMLSFGCDAWTALSLKAFINIVCSVVRPLYMRRLIRLPFLQYTKSVFVPIIAVTLFSVPLPLLASFMHSEGLPKLLITSAISIVAVVFFSISFGLNSKERGLLYTLCPIKSFSFITKYCKR